MNIILQSSNNTITNPVIDGALGTGGNTGRGAADIIAILMARGFTAALGVGSIIMMVYFVISSFRWLTAKDSNTVQEARQGIINAIVGMAVLASVFAIANFVAPLLGLSNSGCQFPQQICWPTF